LNDVSADFCKRSRPSRRHRHASWYKERYEIHHGVRISDSAIVAAVRLSSRYVAIIASDKAVDLIDEAGSALRLQIDSMPEELDRLKREEIRTIEKRALQKEEDSEARRGKDIEKSLADLSEKTRDLERADKRKNIIGNS
jgi:ATP-dependent Clp protease ATP-binding subunit ClpB